MTIAKLHLAGTEQLALDVQQFVVRVQACLIFGRCLADLFAQFILDTVQNGDIAFQVFDVLLVVDNDGPFDVLKRSIGGEADEIIAMGGIEEFGFFQGVHDDVLFERMLLSDVADEKVVFMEELQMGEMNRQDSFEIRKGHLMRVERASLLGSEGTRRRDHQQTVFFQMLLDVGDHLGLDVYMLDQFEADGHIKFLIQLELFRVAAGKFKDGMVVMFARVVDGILR